MMRRSPPIVRRRQWGESKTNKAMVKKQWESKTNKAQRKMIAAARRSPPIVRPRQWESKTDKAKEEVAKMIAAARRQWESKTNKAKEEEEAKMIAAARRRQWCCCCCLQCNNNSTTKTSSRTEWMDLLPEEVLEMVLARLPILEVFRLRCVCKAWNRILRSPNFFALHGQAAPSETWMMNQSLIVGPWTEFIFMFDPATGRSFRPPLPPVDGLSWHCCAATTATAGGLVCLPASGEDGVKAYFVLNILTASVRKLPPVPLQQPIWDPVAEIWDTVWSVFMTQDQEDSSIHKEEEDEKKKKKKNTYRVFLVYSSRRVAIYDSSTQAWIKVGKPGTSHFPLFSRVTMVHGQLFAIFDAQYPHISVYDSHRQEWTGVDLPWPSWASDHRSLLVGCRNRRTVLLVPDFSPAGTCQGFGVWDLQQDPNKCGKKKWVEMARTPKAPQFAALEADDLLSYFHTNGNLIVMTGLNADSTQFLHPVVYDLSLNRWQFLPSSQWHPWYVRTKLAYVPIKLGYVSLTVLDPNLAATP